MTQATVDDATTVLRARARRLSRRSGEEGGGDAFEVLGFRLADERFAIATADVHEVVALRHLTPLPGTPDFVAGIVNVRGRVAMVLSLKRFLALPEQGLTDVHRVVLIGDGSVGLLADLNVQVAMLDRASLGPPLPAAASHVQGVTPDGTVLLAVSRILADPRLQIGRPGDGSPVIRRTSS